MSLIQTKRIQFAVRGVIPDHVEHTFRRKSIIKLLKDKDIRCSLLELIFVVVVIRVKNKNYKRTFLLDRNTEGFNWFVSQEMDGKKAFILVALGT